MKYYLQHTVQRWIYMPWPPLEWCWRHSVFGCPCMCDTKKVVNTVLYKLAVRIFPNSQFRCSWGQCWTESILRSEVKVTEKFLNQHFGRHFVTCLHNIWSLSPGLHDTDDIFKDQGHRWHFSKMHFSGGDIPIDSLLLKMSSFQLQQFDWLVHCRVADGQHRYIQRFFCGIGHCNLLFWIAAAGRASAASLWPHCSHCW